jgi:hypothetical protein
MANIIQDVILRVSSDAEGLRKGVGQVDDKVKETSKNTGGLQNQFKKLLPALGVAAIVAGFKKIATASLQAYDVQAKAETKVQQAIKSTQGVASRTLEQLKQQAKDLQKTTLFGDEEILKGATATLLTFTKISGEQFDEAQKVVLDLSTAMGTDLQSASLQVGKALNDPILGVTALARSGIQFTQQQKDVIKSLAETGKVAEAQKLILQELNTQFGGQAEAAAKVGLGFWKQIQNQIGDASEELGKYMLNFFGLIKEQKKEQEVLADSRNDLNLNLEVLKKSNLSQDARNKLIEETNKKYGKYLPNLLTEKSTIEEIEAAQRASNKQLLFKIASLDYEEKRKKILEDQATATNYLVGSQIDYNKQLEEALKDPNAPRQYIAYLEEQVKTQEEQAQTQDLINQNAISGMESLDEFYKKFAESLGGTFEDLFDQEAGNAAGKSMIDGVVDGAEEAAKEADMSKVARELQVELYKSLSEYMEAEAPEFKDELENALRIKLGIDTEESTADVDTWLKENKEKTDEVDFKPKIDGDEIVKGIDQILRTSKDLIDSLPIGEKAQKEIERLDELIEKQKEAVDKAKTYAEEGNSEQLALEENRLSRLENLQKQEQQQKEQALKRSLAIQKSMALAEIAINLATTLSNIDKTSAALGPLGIPLKTTQTLQAIAQAAINTASVLSANASFFEGTEDTGKGGRLDSKGGFAAILHPNERVMTAQQNKRIKQALGNVSNDDLVKMIENSKSLSVNPGGLLVDSSAINEKMNTKMDEMISLNREMLKAMKRNGVNVSIDRNGLSVMMHQMVQRQNILNSL